jgi:hypothetical protein
LDLLRVQAQEAGPESHLLPDLLGKELIVRVLKDKSDPERFGARSLPHLPGLGLQQPPEKFDHGSFAAAVGTYDGREFSFPEGDGKIL